MTTKTDHHFLIYSLYQIGAIQFGDFKLKSGQTSPIYINLRKIISYPNILRSIVKLMWEKTRSCQFDLVCGVPYTALPIATCLSLDFNIPMLMRRREKKDYGTKQIIEGEFVEGQSCLIVEDVVTTGSSVLETISDLEKAGLKINDIIALIDREQGGKENIEKKYKLHAIFTLSDVLHALLNSTLLHANERSVIEEYFLKRSA